ncbi:TrkA-N domain protein [Kalymmatonema gypsitolerans NIES-4073]|nr:TrkA-N domain protein [Scytonema sp. NIES-4073]
MRYTTKSEKSLDKFLVCGLGGLGQHCVVALKKFEVSVIAIDKIQPQDWEIPNLADLWDDLVIGDCRQINILQQAKIQQCRAAIIVTSNEQVNAETALVVRKLNPQTRLVVRSSKQNLNELLSEHLGNFVAFEPTQLPASTFALAALGTETLGFFNIEGEWLRVVKRVLSPGDRWCYGRLLHELNTHTRKILYISSDGASLSESFYEWEPDTPIKPGDTIVYIEATKPSAPTSEKLARNIERNPWHLLRRLKRFNWLSFKQQIAEFWRKSDENQLQQVWVACLIIVGFLLLVGTVLYQLNNPKMSLIDSFFVSAMLLLGGFGDLFGGFDFEFPVSVWLRFISLGITIAGTVLVGILYSFLTERLLTARFQLSKRRPPIPQKDHVVVVGLGRVGQRVVALLQEYKQPLVGITLNTDFDTTILPEMPLIAGSLKESLAKANLNTAKSVVVVTDEEMLNLEIGLMAYDANPGCHLVIRTTGQGLSENLARLLPSAQVLSAYAVAAEAFAGAAFGEEIIHLFRVNQKTILVTEYQIEADDTLNGLLLSEVAYGYGVVPILYIKEQEAPKLMPSEDIRLSVGDAPKGSHPRGDGAERSARGDGQSPAFADRMVVLATTNGLRRIEHGTNNSMLKSWQVHVERALTAEAVFEGANAITRISGCSLTMARNFMNNLPGTLHSPLYKHQAQRLIRELSKSQVIARLVPMTAQQGTDSI